MLQPGRRHQGDVAEGCAAEVGHDRPIALAPQALGLAGVVLQVGVADRTELLEVVLDAETLLVDRLLPRDAVEIEPALGHPPAGRHALVALGIEQDVAVGIGLSVEMLGDQHRRAIEGSPRLPARVLEAEHVPPSAQGDGVHAQGVLQVGPISPSIWYGSTTLTGVPG